eukprot:TRINITY_DN9787_c0_g2_i1.p1 TRINITY_DN9787_c0_g2~~TRINITY_DN9787_c0_g2_i1.p1  ORF type:complete len:548 (-),score=52.56 TRINITY_DN9787_c0_g2_i1:79-1722(-)
MISSPSRTDRLRLALDFLSNISLVPRKESSYTTDDNEITTFSPHLSPSLPLHLHPSIDWLELGLVPRLHQLVAEHPHYANQIPGSGAGAAGSAFRTRAATDFLRAITLNGEPGKISPDSNDQKTASSPLPHRERRDSVDSQYAATLTHTDSDSHSYRRGAVYCPALFRPRRQWERNIIRRGIVNQRVYSRVTDGAPLFLSSTLYLQSVPSKNEADAPWQTFLQDVAERSENSETSKHYSNRSFASLFEHHEMEREKEEDTYDPFFLDDPDIKSGKHRTVMNLPGFMVSVIGWVEARELRQELNQQFRQKHSWLHPSLSLSKIRKLKQKILEITRELNLEVSTAALAYVYFEKLTLKNLVVKANRRVVAGSCLVLAFKCNEANTPGFTSLPQLFQSIEEHLGIKKSDIVASEFAVLAALEFTLEVPHSALLPHFFRLLHTLDITAQDYLGAQQYEEVLALSQQEAGILQTDVDVDAHDADADADADVDGYGEGQGEGEVGDGNELANRSGSVQDGGRYGIKDVDRSDGLDSGGMDKISDSKEEKSYAL